MSHIPFRKLFPLLVFALVVLIFALMDQNGVFLSQRNLTNLTRQVAVNGLLAFGMTAIILIRGIDLSVGSSLALVAVLGALTQVHGFGEWGILGGVASVAVTFLGAFAISASNGFLVSKLRIPSFISSLGFLVMARGLALIFSSGSKISPLSDSYRWMGTSFINPQISIALLILIGSIFSAWILWRRRSHWIFSIGVVAAATALALWIFGGYQGIPVPVLVLFLMFGICYWVLEESLFGRWVYAVGGNPEAAKLAGIPVAAIQFFTFLSMGIFVALGAVIESGRLDAGDPNGGQLYELDAIAAVVIGGTSLQGGVGRISGTLLGAFLMGTLNNGMSLMSVPTHYQMVLKGAIIIAAVAVDNWVRKKS